MAQFCTKCGSPLPEGMKFCTGCGAVVGGPPAPPAQVPAMQPPPPPAAPMTVAPAPMAPAQMAPAAAAPAAKSGSSAVKIVLIIVAVIIFLIAISAASCVYFVYRVKQKANQFEKQVQATIPMRAGTREVHMQPTTPAQPSPTDSGPVIDLASLVYPGSTAKEGASMAMGGFQVQQYTTDDPVDKVESFYKAKLGPQVTVQESNGQAVVQSGGSNGVVSISIGKDAASGKTLISVTRIGK